jgi:Tfp pilus assembly protein PilF
MTTHAHLSADRPTSPAPSAASTHGPWIALCIIVFLLYWPSLSASFVLLDDFQYVIDNARIREPSLAGALAFFREYRQPTTVDGYYQPLTMVSLMLDAVISGVDNTYLSPAIFHFMNIALHALTSVLVYLLLRQLKFDAWPAFLATLIYAVHPTAVESVSWISQRKTVLATPLAVGAVMAYLRYGRSLQRGWLWLCFLLYLMANLAKPTIVLLPLVLPLLDIWPLGRAPVSCLKEKWPLAIGMAVLGWVAWMSQASTGDGMAFANLSTTTLLVKWMGLFAYNVTLYLGNVFWPMYLSPFRAMPGDFALANPAILFSLLLVAALTAFWLTTWRWCKPLFVGMAAFAIMISPALGPVRFMASCVADRFIYFPLVFLVMPLGMFLQRAETLTRGPFFARLVIGGVVLSMLVLTRAQQRVWQDSKTLWSHVAESVPDFCKAYGNLALVYLQEEDFDRSMDYANRALRIDPEHGDSLHLLGRALTRVGRGREAIVQIEHAVRVSLGPSERSAWIAHAEAHASIGNTAQARSSCEKAIARGADPAVTYSMAGNAAMLYGHRYEIAIEFYRESLARDPQSTRVRGNLGTALAAMGRDGEALVEYEKVIAEFSAQGRPADEVKTVVAQLRKKIAARGSTSPTTKPASERR